MGEQRQSASMEGTRDAVKKRGNEVSTLSQGKNTLLLLCVDGVHSNVDVQRGSQYC